MDLATLIGAASSSIDTMHGMSVDEASSKGAINTPQQRDASTGKPDFDDENHPDLIVDGVNTKTGAISEPQETRFKKPMSAIPEGEKAPMAGRSEWPAEPPGPVQSVPADSAVKSSRKQFAQEPGQKWEMWDPKRGLDADTFRTVAKQTLSKIDEESGKGFDSHKAIELLAMTAANETNLGRYMKVPGKSRQRGIMQMTDGAIEDAFTYMKKYPELLKAVNSLREPEVPLMTDVEQNLPLSIALARVHYAQRPEAIPSDVKGMSHYYKQWYNSYDPRAKATPKGAEDAYRKWVLKEGGK